MLSSLFVLDHLGKTNYPLMQGQITTLTVSLSIYSVRVGREVNLHFPAQSSASASEAKPLQVRILMRDMMLYLPHCCYTQRLWLGEHWHDLDTILWFMQGR